MLDICLAFTYKCVLQSELFGSGVMHVDAPKHVYVCKPSVDNIKGKNSYSETLFLRKIREKKTHFYCSKLFYAPHWHLALLLSIYDFIWSSLRPTVRTTRARGFHVHWTDC